MQGISNTGSQALIMARKAQMHEYLISFQLHAVFENLDNFLLLHPRRPSILSTGPASYQRETLPTVS
jgi:hypothetical protein